MARKEAVDSERSEVEKIAKIDSKEAFKKEKEEAKKLNLAYPDAGIPDYDAIEEVFGLTPGCFDCSEDMSRKPFNRISLNKYTKLIKTSTQRRT